MQRWYEDDATFRRVNQLREVENFTWVDIGTTLQERGWQVPPTDSLRRQYSEERRKRVFRQHELGLDAPGTEVILPDKKSDEVSWREWVPVLQEMQRLKSKSSRSNDRGVVDFSRRTSDLCVVPLCDWHIGSWGTDYAEMLARTDSILSHPDIYFASLGDMTQMSIVFRSMLEIADNALPPQTQQEIHESWLDEMAGRLLFGTWDNHSVIREEKAVGYSRYAKAYQDRALYFNGIAHVDIHLGREVYKVAASHKFRGNSYINPTHGQMRYLRMEGHDREVALAGDSHVPAIAKYVEGSRLLQALNGGSMQDNSGFGKRFFSLTTWKEWPCVIFRADKHVATPLFSIEEWLHYRGEA